ncbi:MAG TPA: MFS transporter [Desulfobacteria bacterium]|nr:MFS transporter [Desulfobacteria bacterium]
MFEHLKSSPSYRWFILANVSVGTFMSTLDASIVNVALPTIAAKMQTSLATLQWVITAYLLAISSLLPVFGRIADLIGRKRVYSMGFVVFTLGSVLCAFSQNIWFLVGMRVLQAFGASMLMSNSSAIVTSTFDPKERGRALGMIGSVVALGSLAGPALGGILIGLTGDWRWIFFINLPIGIIGYIAAWFILPSDKPTRGNESFDFGGATFFTLGMISLLLAVNNGEDWGWSSLPIIIGFILGVVLLALFFFTELKVKHPMIHLSLFRNRPFLIGNLSGLLQFTSMFGNNMLLPFYLQHVLNLGPTYVGLLMTSFPVVMAITAPISGLASDRIGPVALTTGGLVCSALGMFYLAHVGADTSPWLVLPGPLLMGLGSGLFNSPNNSSVMSSVPRNKLGVAGGINALVRNVGMVVGIAYSVSLFEALGGVNNPAKGQQVATFISAYHTVMLTSMVIALIAAVISLNRKGYATPEQGR